MKKWALLFMLLAAGAAQAAPITLDNQEVSQKDKASADELRNTTRAPNSFIGGAAESAVKSLSESVAQHSKACENGAADFIIVDFDVVAGFTEGVDRVFSMFPVDSATGHTEQNASRNGATISKSYNTTLAGNYRWNASWDNNRKMCSGKLYVSGRKCNVSIRVHSDCSSAGDSEF